MCAFQRVTLKDKPILDPYFAAGRYENSEMCFTNAFLWGQGWDIAYDILDDAIAMMRATTPEGKLFFFPPLIKDKKDLCRAMRWGTDLAKAEGVPFEMRGVPDPVRELILSSCKHPERYEICEDRNNWDYVYNASDLITLRGNRYHGKRNHLNQLRARTSFTYEALNEQNARRCLENYYLWYERHKSEERMLRSEQSLNFEKDAIERGLANWQALGLVGGMILIEGEVQAFALGEQLTEDMAVVHFEKANTEYPGLYALINQQFAEHAFADMTFINREEDMGLPGLRKAKESYHPVRMIRKYIVTEKDSVHCACSDTGKDA
nr:phosphatidylglycerol lysyltransferase domain-containing protein [Maliibacterium massiliense]